MNWLPYKKSALTLKNKDLNRFQITEKHFPEDFSPHKHELIKNQSHINLMSDFGFKRLMYDTRLAIGFLNEALKGIATIKTITKLDKEFTGQHVFQRTAVFDILCLDDQGREIIVEIQRTKQNYYLDRLVYYGSAHIFSTSSLKGTETNKLWASKPKRLIILSLVDFPFEYPGFIYPDEHQYQFQYQIHEVGRPENKYDGVVGVIIDLSKFAKYAKFVLKNNFDKFNTLEKWLFQIKFIHEMKQLPNYMQHGDFFELAQMARIGNLNKTQMLEYQNNLKVIFDEQSSKASYEADVKNQKELAEAEKRARIKERKEKIAAQKKAKEERIEKLAAQKKAKEAEILAKEAEKQILAAAKNFLTSTQLSVEQIATALSLEVHVVEGVKKSLKIENQGPI